MKPLYLCFLAVLFAACQSSSKEKTTILPQISSDSLKGNWIILRVRPNSNNKKIESIMRSATDPLIDNLELSIFSFQPGGVLTAYGGEIAEDTGKWETNSAQQLMLSYPMLASKDKEVPFTVTGFRNDSLIIENIITGNGKDTLHITYTLKKIRRSDSIPDILSDASNSWRYTPGKPEDDATIRLRLKKILAYYSAYFATLVNNKVFFFNTKKILCPVLFYQGGMGLKRYDIADKWTQLFYDSKDAWKAHAMLDKLFASYDSYPDKGSDYVQEYIIALKELSEKL